jgi:hypothetical protein
MAEMQVAIGFRRETGAQFGAIERRGGVISSDARMAGPAALGVLAGGKVGFNDILDEIRGGGDFWLVGAAHGKTSDLDSAILTGRGLLSATNRPGSRDPGRCAS